MLSKDIVIAEEKNFFVIDKPSGVSVHGGEKVMGEILSDFLVELYPKLKSVGDMPHVRPGIVHRLDKDTSGVMVIARTQDAYEALKNEFMERRVEKTYLGLSNGVIKKDVWEIKTAVGRSRKRYTKQVSVPLTAEDEAYDFGAVKDPKIAVTEFEVIERLQNRYTLFHAYPKTGRMHQIRVQIASFGFPIVCDPLYKGKKGSCPPSLGRLFLHAESIKFKLFEKEYEYTSPPSKVLTSFLLKLGYSYKPARSVA